jgi:NADPH-dependent 2,4-dienoyl-CoA reductase/sulfur reductase-like enzyme
MTIGVQPNVAWLRGVEGLELERGVMVDDYFRTTLPDVYAVGDCVQFRDACPGHPPIEQLWYTGRIHGETVARTILGRETEYDRGVWFNSAKFFDIEYQTYGLVPPAFGDHDDCFYWESADGCRALRVVYRKSDRIVIGAHTFGIRHRQDVWESWLRAGRDVDDVMRDLRLANFDPEFSRRHEREILRAYENAS